MTTASIRDGASGLARRPECACRKGDGVRIFALMKAGVQAHHWSRVLFLYMGLLAASVKGKSPSVQLKTCKMQQAYPTHTPPTLPEHWTECKSASATRTHPKGTFLDQPCCDVAVLAPKVINRGDVAGWVAILVTADPQELSN